MAIYGCELSEDLVSRTGRCDMQDVTTDVSVNDT